MGIGCQSYSKIWNSGYDVKPGASDPMHISNLGSHVMSGVFGTTANFRQGGSWKGNFQSLPAKNKYCTLVQTNTGRPTILIDKKSGSVFFSDIDQISQLGGTSNSDQCGRSNNDRLFCNLYTFLLT